MREIVSALTRKFGGLTKLDDTCLNKIVLSVAKRFRRRAPARFRKMLVPGMK
jgi:hypothetical protein